MCKVLFTDRELFGSCEDAYKLYCAANILKIYYGFRECYTEFTGYDITAYDYVHDLKTKNKIDGYIKNCCKATLHKTPLEHVSVTFEISEVSRTCSHQNVRHRIASFNQKSQRYVGGHGETVVPASVMKNEEAKNVFLNTVKASQACYDELKKLGIPNEDARFILTEGSFTHYQMTMNFNSLINFLGLRLCTRAQWEIRSVAQKILEYLKKDYEPIFGNIGPSCVQIGYCPEGKKGCGKYPTRDTLLSCWTKVHKEDE
jgi:thymidylate synthase (FAD)